MAESANNSEKPLISLCPFCSDKLRISELRCDGCDTEIRSTLSVPEFFRLSPDLQEFVVLFLRVRGNIREMEKELGISYPTVCKRLDLINELMANADKSAEARAAKRFEVLDRLERGEISAGEAVELLKPSRKS